MNEFVAKKLGEVLAFAEVGSETIERGKAAFILVLGDDEVLGMLEKNKVHSDEIKKLASDNGVVEIVLNKAEDTKTKLRQMRDMYIAEKWDNPVELLEWSSFFHGAGSAHWALIKGCAETLNHEALIILAEEAQNFHHETLDTIASELQEEGQSKASPDEPENVQPAPKEEPGIQK